MNKSTTIFLAGHRGMVGHAQGRVLKARGYHNVITATRRTLDLTDQAATFRFIKRHRPEVLIMSAARVGGIWGNYSYPGNFIGENLMIQTNLLEAARRFEVGTVLFMSSACIYPRLAPQPMREQYLLSGPLEETNQYYAVAKLAGGKMGEAYASQYGLRVITALPCNLYGPRDNFDPESSHVIPALLHKFQQALEQNDERVTLWGSGRAIREFMHVEDLAEASALLLEQAPSGDYNLGTGEECSIAELAEKIARVAGFDGGLNFDSSRPDGTPRKLLDSSKIAALGWQSRITLEQGLADTWRWLSRNQGQLRKSNPGHSVAAS